jgi:PAS domain S-box-containing protein
MKMKFRINLVKFGLAGALFFLCAQLGFLTILKSISVPLVWFSAGLGQAVTLAWGWPGALGVFVGSLFSMPIAFHNPLVVLLMAFGAIGQAGLSAWLIRRFVGVPFPETSSQTVRTLLFSTLGALLGPLPGLLGRLVLEQLPFSDFLDQYGLFWLSGMSGIFFIMPLTVYSIHRLEKKPLREPFLWPMTSLILGVMLTILLLLSNFEQQRFDESLERDTVTIVNNLSHNMQDEIQNLSAIGARFHSGGDVLAGEFDSFASLMLVNSRTSRFYAWLPKVDPAAAAGFEQDLRAQGQAGFSIKNKNTTGEVFYPFALIEPQQTYQSLLGLDAASQPAFLQGIRLAVESGQPVLTEPVNLPNQQTEQAAIMILSPVYLPGMPLQSSPQERRANLLGLVAGKIVATEFLNQAIQSMPSPDLALYLFDMQDPANPLLVGYLPSSYNSQPAAGGAAASFAALQTGLHSTRDLQLQGRHWRLVLRPGADFLPSNLWMRQLGACLVGLLLAGGLLTYVHNRQKNQLKLELSEGEFRNLSEHALTGVVRIGSSGEFEYANQAAAQIFGFETPGQLIGQQARAFVPSQGQSGGWLDLFAAGPEVRNQEVEIRDQHSQTHSVLISGSSTQAVISATLVDITFRKRAEDELRQLSGVVDQMADPVMITDVNGVIEYVNPAFEQVTGYTSPEVIGKPPRMLKSGLMPAEFYQELWGTILAGDVFVGELSNRRKNGEIFLEILTISPLRDAFGAISHFIATSKDITDRKQAEISRMESEQRYRNMFEKNMAVMLIIDPEKGFIMDANPSACAFYGWTRAQLLGMRMDQINILSPEEIRAEMQAARSQQRNHFVFKHRLNNGSIRDVEVHSGPLMMDGRNLLYSIIHDITDRIQAENALSQINAEYRLISEHSGDVVWKANAETQEFTYLSPIVTRLLGFSPEELAQRRFSLLLTTESNEKLQAVLPERLAHFMTTGEESTYRDELEQYRKDGSTIPTEVVTSFLLTSTGETQMVGVSRDISERKQAQLLQDTVYRIANDAQNAEALYDLYPQIHRRIADIMPAENFYITMYDESTDMMRYVYSEDEVDKWDTEPFPLNNGLTAYVLRSGKSLLATKEVGAELRATGLYAPVGTMSEVWLGVPLIVHGKTIGVMAVQHYRDPNAYTRREQRILEYVSSQVAIAIDRKQVEEIAHQVERRNSSLIQNAPDGIVLIDVNGKFLFASPSAYRIFGFSPGELIGSASIERVHPEDVKMVYKAFMSLFHAPTEIIRLRYRYMHKDGSYRWLDSTFSNLLDEPGVNAVVNNFHDITDRKLAEDALSSSQLRLALALEGTNAGLWDWFIQSGVMYVNKTWAEMLGYTLAELEPVTIDTWRSLCLPEDLLIEDQHLEMHFAGKTEFYQTETRMLHKDGHVIWVLSTGRVTERSPEGKPLRMTGTHIDISDRIRASQQLQESQARLETAQKVARLGSWELDYKTGVGYWSPEMYRLFFRNPQEGVPPYEDWMVLVPQEDRRSLHSAQQISIELREPVTYVHQVAMPDGNYGYYEARLQAMLDDEGQVLRMTGTVMDVTERRKMENEIRERVKELTCLFNISRLLENSDISEDEICRQIVAQLGPAMQFPFLAAPVIELDGILYTSNNFSETLTGGLSANIVVMGVERGKLSVFYTRQMPFILPEEQSLIANLARMFGMWLERGQSERELRESNERFGQLAANIQEVFWMYDVQTRRMIYLSPAFETIWGSPVEEAYRDTLAYFAAILPEDQPLARQANQDQTMGETSVEYRIRRPDGSLRWVWDRGFPIFDRNGQHVRTVGVATDLTVVKEAQQALEELNRDLELRVEQRTNEVREREATYRALFEKSNDGILLISPSDTEMRPNQRALDMLGYSPLDWQEMTVERIILPDQHEETMQHYQRVLLGELEPIFESVFLRKDGSEVPVEINLSAVRDPAGQVMLVQSVVRDITERKRADDALRASSELFNEFMRFSPIYAFIKEVTPSSSRVLYASENFADITGIPGSKMVGHAMQELFPPDFAEKITQDDWAVVASRQMLVLEEQLNGRSYTTIKFPIFQKDRDLLAGYTIDNTERKNAEDLLRASEERYRRAISAADAVPYSLDYKTNQYSFMGEGIVHLTGYSREEITPTLLFSIIMEEVSDVDMVPYPAEDLYRRIRSGETPASTIWRADYHIKSKTGQDRWLSDASVQVLDEAGRVNGAIGILLDITDRKQAETSLRESRDKLSAANAALEKASRLKDEFLASMSHELRTPLTGILGLAEALQFQTHGSLNERQLKAMRNIEKSGRHLLELINDILDLSKIEAGKFILQLDSCSVVDVCQSSLQLVKGMAAQKSQNIQFEITPPTFNLVVDVRRLKQMLVNLLSNAIKFTPERGGIGLKVEANPEENQVRFIVWDQGIGIKFDQLGKLFQPFVQLDSSLARQYAGTGLGLSLVQRMAELHGGGVQVESTYGAGSRFSIILPWVKETPRPEGDGATVVLNNPNAQLLEKNLFDAEHLARFLTDLGVEGLVHPSLRGALDKAAETQPSAIFLDTNQQDGSAFDLLADLRHDERTRDIPVVIVSADESQSDNPYTGAAETLLKPFSRESLRACLSRLTVMSQNKPVLVVGRKSLVPLLLIADDNELILETITEFLQQAGLRVQAVRNGFELLERAVELKPDIILVDIQMPGMDGMEVIRRLRRSSDNDVASVPIIAITALAMSGDRERCIEAGANDYISKPIVLRQLVKSVLRLVAGKN